MADSRATARKRAQSTTTSSDHNDKAPSEEGTSTAQSRSSSSKPHPVSSQPKSPFAKPSKASPRVTQMTKEEKIKSEMEAVRLRHITWSVLFC